MVQVNLASTIVVLFLLSACSTSLTPNYIRDLEQSGFPLSKISERNIQPYPNSDDVCVVLRNTQDTAKFVDNQMMLIGCPRSEFGAINDKITGGAHIVGQSDEWTLLSLAN